MCAADSGQARRGISWRASGISPSEPAMPAVAWKRNAANAGIHRARHQRGYVVRVTGVLYGTTRRSLHPVREFLFAAGFAFQLRRVAPATTTPAPSLAAFPFPTPLPRRGHRFHFTLPTPLPGARYSLRLAIPSSLCLSYHSARPELQCGYPPFTAAAHFVQPKINATAPNPAIASSPRRALSAARTS